MNEHDEAEAAPGGRVAVGHPIDVASGEFFAFDIDHSLDGVVPITLGRHFNTKFLRAPLLERVGGDEAPELPFGPGWRASFIAELRPTMVGFRYTRADGTEYALRDLAPEAARFEQTGKLLSAEHGLELSRIDERRLRLVGYARGREPVSLVFEEHQARRYRLAAYERTPGARVVLGYDLEGRLVALSQTRERRSYRFAYQDGRVVQVSLGLEFAPTRVVAEYDYDRAGRLVQVRDERGSAATYGYDDEGRIVHDGKRGGSVYTVRYAGGRCEHASGTDGYQERSLRYDIDGRTTRVTDSHGGVTTYEWNPRGQVVKTVSPTGAVTRVEFDALGREARRTDIDGRLGETEYDALGRVSVERRPTGEEAHYAYDAQHRVMSVTLRAGEEARTAHYTYDDEHNLTSERLGDTTAWQYAYTRFGERERTVAPNGAEALVRYDERGGVVAVTDADGGHWGWTRDSMGRALTATDPLGHVQTVEYFDPDGRSYRLRDADGRVYEHHVSTDDRTVVDLLPGGRRRSLELSFCGQPLVYTDETGATTQLSWGSEPDELRSITDANGATYAFGYDRDMRLVSRRTFDGRLFLTRWEGSRVIASVDPAGRETTYAYDRHGRLKAMTSPDNETAYSYDAFGRLVSMGSAESTTTYLRDEQGRVVAEEQEGHRLEWTLGPLGEPLAQRSSFGAEASHRFSPGGRCLEVLHGDAHVSFQRDALGREVARAMGASARLEQTYDPVGRLLSQRLHAGPSTTLARTFDYDPAGFLSTISDSLRGETRLHHNARGDLTGVLRSHGTSDAHVFDPARNRVYSAWTAHTAALDEALERAERDMREGTVLGNPLDLYVAQTPHDEATFAHARGNRLERVDRSDGSALLYAYDASGQVVAKTLRRGDHDVATWRFAWNARGDLVTFTTPNGKDWHYRYDTLGRRVEKRSPTGEVWRYVWAGAVLLHTLKNGTLVETYVHEPGGRCPLARLDTDLHYIVPDAIGAPSEELAPDGSLTWLAQKGTWGEGFSRIGPTGGEPFLGQWADAESGLSYNFFRYYDPDLGRYLSPDPIDLLGGLNLYVGVTDPFGDVDRWGLFKTVDFSGQDVFAPVGRGQYNEVKIKLTGNRSRDFEAANSAANLDSTPAGFVWHHVADFNKATGTSTLQLVTTEAHDASKPHEGSVKQFEQAFGVKYDSKEAGDIAQKKKWWQPKRARTCG